MNIPTRGHLVDIETISSASFSMTSYKMGYNFTLRRVDAYIALRTDIIRWPLS